MSVTSRKIIDKIEILETGDMQVREVTVFEDGGVEMGRSPFRRRVVSIEDDITLETDPRVKAIGEGVRALPNKPKPPLRP